MTKRIKTPTIIEAYKHRSLIRLIGGISVARPLLGGLVWLKTVFSLPMEPDELDIAIASAQGSENLTVAPSEIYTIVGRRGDRAAPNGPARPKEVRVINHE